MKVTLIYATPNAREILIFTKNTRLEMAPEGLDDIMKWSDERKDKELEYMSETIPSSWEFVDMIFCIQDVTRAFTHQLVRTRTASYAQQSMRATEMKNFGYRTEAMIELNPKANVIYAEAMENIQRAYNRLLELHCQPEDARGILPTNIHTNIVAKYNLRSFAELFRKRSSGRVQGEYSECLTGMAAELFKAWPWSLQFLMDKKHGALDLLTKYFTRHMEEEMKDGIVKTKTNSWNMLKKIDLLRDML